jgi:hypothetical protein
MALNAGNTCKGGELDLRDQERVGVQQLDAQRLEHLGGEILEVGGHDAVRVTGNGCCQDVPVIHIGELNGRARGRWLLRIMCLSSMPSTILAVQWTSLNPSIDRVPRSMAR